MKISKDSDNQSVLILGRSGSGKTFALQTIEKNIADSGGIVLVLNYYGTHEALKKDENVIWINASAEGIPLTILTPIKRPDETVEDELDIAEAVLDVFYSVCPNMGSRQRAVLREAVIYAIKDRRTVEDEIGAIGSALHKMNEKAAEALFDNFFNVFAKVKLFTGQKIFERGKITVLDLSNFSENTQSFAAELVLSCLWRYFRIWGQYSECDLYVVCDEFQALNLRPKSILSKILREGRKYHMALLLATQSLKGFEKGTRAILQQAATQLYFHPAPSEIGDIVKALNVEEKDIFADMLSNLKRGECVAKGRFKVGGICIERPIKVKF